MGSKSLTAVDRSISLLDRVPVAQSQLTEAQTLTDQLVSVSIQEGSNLKTAAAMLGAGWVGRFTRIGAISSLPGQVFARGASYVPAMAAESAAFAGIERGFHPSHQSFQKDWARSAVTLTGLKAFGGMSRGQNIILQHLFTDLGLVGGHHAASVVGVMDKPQGNFARQMFEAEMVNWQMKGSLAFAHSVSPGLSAVEKSVDLALKSQEAGLSKHGLTPFFSQAAMASAAGPEGFSGKPEKADDLKGPLRVFSKGDEKGWSAWWKRQKGTLWGPKTPAIPEELPFPQPILMSSDNIVADLNEALGSSNIFVRVAAVRTAVDLKNPDLRPALERALVDSSGRVRIVAAWALAAQDVPAGREYLEKSLDLWEQPTPELRTLAATILSGMDRPVAMTILEKSLKSDPDWGVRADVIRLLEKHKGAEGRMALERVLLSDPEGQVRFAAARALGDRGDFGARPALERALNDSEKIVRAHATLALAKIGVKSLKLADTFHDSAVAFIEKAKVLKGGDSASLGYLRAAIDLEWAGAQCIPPGNESHRAMRYKQAALLALSTEQPEKVKAIIFDALKDDFGLAAEDKLRDLAKKLRSWEEGRALISGSIAEAHARLKILKTLDPALARPVAGPDSSILLASIYSSPDSKWSSAGEASAAPLSPRRGYLKVTSTRGDDSSSRVGRGGTEEGPSASSSQELSLFREKLKSLAETPAEKVPEWERLKAYEKGLEGKKSIYLIVAIIKMAQEKIRTGEVSSITPEAFIEELYRKMPEAEKDLTLDDFFRWFGLTPQKPKE